MRQIIPSTTRDNVPHNICANPLRANQQRRRWTTTWRHTRANSSLLDRTNKQKRIPHFREQFPISVTKWVHDSIIHNTSAVRHTTIDQLERATRQTSLFWNLLPSNCLCLCLSVPRAIDIESSNMLQAKRRWKKKVHPPPTECETRWIKANQNCLRTELRTLIYCLLQPTALRGTKVEGNRI